MRFVEAFLISAIVAVTPICSFAKSSDSAHQHAPGFTPHTSHVPQIFPFACAPGSATYVSGGGSKAGLILEEANHSYECNFQNGTAGFLVHFNNGQTIPLESMTLSLANGLNGTINIYVNQPNGQFSTYSLPFTNLSSGKFTILPSQLNPSLPTGTMVTSMTIDANPCQQVTVKNFQVNGVSGSIHLNSIQCVCIGNPPN